ncbi:PREDICTED: uncharacterized protein LOC108781868 [Cyphomyrmex costatus]|uniref:uncharacterized protein LOC108781868 n=1 Tax=Cyphomyrmex costatus TaxID=456900 RepID=UPI0008523F4C|nr:PREDICTED: uncharacterized protein LOC108781868 [Cyphomyrmex costatus]
MKFQARLSREAALKPNLLHSVIDKITEQLPIYRINKAVVDILNNLELADPTYHIPRDVDILIGASIFWDLMRGGQIRGSNRSLVFQETLLSWIVAGSLTATNTCQRKKSYCGMTITLHKQLEKFWSMDEIEQSSPISKEEKLCEEHFVKTHVRDLEGQFIVRLPLKDNIDELGDSSVAAAKRFKAK